jgi:hypothetical protein
MAFSGHRFGAMEATHALRPCAAVLSDSAISAGVFRFHPAGTSRGAVTYGYVTAIRSSYAFTVLLIGYALLTIGCLFRRV